MIRALSSKGFCLAPSVILKNSVRYSSGFDKPAPAPPQLPKEEQEEFERLQKIANAQAAIDEYNASGSVSETPKVDIGGFSALYKPIPEFEGDVNPVTGEVGGPKQEPTRHGDWSFNGRVTDF
ncbi:unnamed protein product [Kuraishia capsulata CBS 1993]|uniref:Succinate dehydrogenase assembly factor 4, mitochondrial n=1 Tax=Kuraishia capsulata CBS 1993 TaxID=1382522 RepID=W6MJ27_9ASCO|nr:uncharacterized protein KUCA_T00002187001 [Kuraishia capsulata CBS 1993]CDK26216.1 unnamed protein product [Kuraishia capsulata CBS 1993]